MSGADEPESQEQIISGMKETYPDVCDEVFVASDTWGALFTATASGNCAPHLSTVFTLSVQTDKP